MRFENGFHQVPIIVAIGPRLTLPLTKPTYRPHYDHHDDHDTIDDGPSLRVVTNHGAIQEDPYQRCKAQGQDYYGTQGLVSLR